MPLDPDRLQQLADQFLSVLNRIEPLLPQAVEPDWDAAVAFRWRRRSSGLGFQSWLQPVRHRSAISLDDLQNIDEAKRLIERNTRQFVQGRPANNVLLTGSRGTGKSSLIKACLNAHADEGLRLIEVDKADLVDLPDIVDLVAERPEKFIVFCDDLSFEEGEAGYKAMKVALDALGRALQKAAVAAATNPQVAPYAGKAAAVLGSTVDALANDASAGREALSGALASVTSFVSDAASSDPASTTARSTSLSSSRLICDPCNPCLSQAVVPVGFGVGKLRPPAPAGAARRESCLKERRFS